MNLLFTVCGRAGSKGLKNKNLRPFLGIPLPYYTFSAIDLFIQKHSEYNDITIAVNTDCNELVEILKKTKLCFKTVNRKHEHATDDAPKIAAIKDTLFVCQYEFHKKFDIVVDLDITSPLRTIGDIELTIEALVQNCLADLAFSVTSSRRNPYFNMVKEENGFYYRVIRSNFDARQQAPIIYDMNASIYAYRNEYLSSENTKGVFDGKAVAHVMKDTAVLDIDSEEDFELMGIIAEYFYEKDNSYGEIRENIKSILK